MVGLDFWLKREYVKEAIDADLIFYGLTECKKIKVTRPLKRITKPIPLEIFETITMPTVEVKQS